MANRSYLKSEKLKATEVDHRKIILLEAENAALKKDKAALEQKIKMLKEVIQKNRGSFLYFLCFWVFQVLKFLLLYSQMVLRAIRRSCRNFGWRLRLWSSRWVQPRTLEAAWLTGCRWFLRSLRVLG